MSTLEEHSEVLDLKRLFDATPSGLRRGVSQVPAGGFARYLTAEINKNKADRVRKEQHERELMGSPHFPSSKWEVGVPLQLSEWKDGAHGALGNHSAWKPTTWEKARTKSRLEASPSPVAQKALSLSPSSRSGSPVSHPPSSGEKKLVASPTGEARTNRALVLSSRQPPSARYEKSPQSDNSPTSVRADLTGAPTYDQTVFPYMLQTNSAYCPVVQESNAQQAQETREEIARWKEEGRREEQKRLARDAANRTEVLAVRVNGLMAKEEMLRSRQLEAEEVLRESCRLHALAAAEREEHQKIANERAAQSFDRRYLTTEECVKTLEYFSPAMASLTPRGYYTMESPDVIGQSYLKPTEGLSASQGLCDRVKSENDALYRRIHHIAARTDDDVSDEAAGKARATMAAKSKARKKKEAQKLAVQNDAYEKKMENVVSKTDCSYDATPMS